MSSSPFKCSVFWASIFVVAASLWIWNERQERRHQAALERQQIQTQRAAALLFRAFHTDNYLTYAALSKTTARMGSQRMESVARIVHAPRRLAIVYLQGDHAGLHSGYNEYSLWRRASDSQPMIPYAQLERPATEMAAARFALMLENYRARWQGHEVLDKRKTEVVELWPAHSIEGARGPSRKLWIDAQTGLTLRQQSFNYRGREVMNSVLTEVDYAPSITDSTFVRPEAVNQAARTKPWVAHDVGDDRERAAKLSGLYPPDAKQLPPGFKFDGVGAHRCETCNAPVCYAVLSRYTDGLNTLTIFALKPNCAVPEEKRAPAEKETQSCDFGAGTLVMRDTSQAQLIAVADLPARTLEDTLESVAIRAYNSR